jgi:uncharacterized protein YeaO (DUF488 family)
MAGVRTKRWNDPVAADDGVRILVTRYRPRGLRKERENWELWAKQLAPSVALHAAAYGKDGPPITFDEYRRRYLDEMKGHEAQIADLAQRVLRGETITLLCSSACRDATRCHRSLLKELIDARLPRELRAPPEAPPSGIVNPAYGKLKSWLE